MGDYYAVQRSDEYLMHYGVKGMKWGVRKAIARGDALALNKHYKKTVKKLLRLEKNAENMGSKKKAKAYGAAAVATGALAGLGTTRIGMAMETVGEAIGRGSRNKKRRAYGNAISEAGRALNAWGSKVLFNAPNQKPSNKVMSTISAARPKSGSNKHLATEIAKNNPLNGVSNNTLARIGLGAVSAGLSAAAIRNAYKSSTGNRRAIQKRDRFRNEAEKVFKGTIYEGKLPRKRTGKRR